MKRVALVLVGAALALLPQTPAVAGVWFSSAAEADSNGNNNAHACVKDGPDGPRYRDDDANAGTGCRKGEIVVITWLETASVMPDVVDIETPADSGSFDVTFESAVDLAGLTAEAFGLSQPSVTTEVAQQDNPKDPSSASVKKEITLEHASRFSVATALDTDDIDLFVVYDANNNGKFTNSEIVGSSTTGSSNEFVELVRPVDGNYQIWVQGSGVAGTPQFELSIVAIQGNDLTVTGVPEGPVGAVEPVSLTVEFDKPMVVGESYFGELLLGTPSAPAALTVPIKITRIA